VATSYFIQFSGIPGDSSDELHEGWCDVLSWSATPHAAAGPQTDSKHRFKELDFMVKSDSAAPRLIAAQATGHLFEKIVFESYKEENRYLHYELKSANIATCNPSDDQGKSYLFITVVFDEISDVSGDRQTKGGVADRFLSQLLVHVGRKLVTKAVR